MTRRQTSVRAAAIRRAHEAKAQRDAERLARERAIEAALADYFEAMDRAAAVRAEARRKADKMLSDAEVAAGTPETAGRDAVRRLRALTGSHAEAAGLCGLSVTAVRAMLRDNTGRNGDSAGPGRAELPKPARDVVGPYPASESGERHVRLWRHG
jgi:hypothetical protein